MKSNKYKNNVNFKNDDKTKLKACNALYSFYKLNKEDFRKESDFFPVIVLDDYVKHRLLTGVESCCFNVGYLTYQIMLCPPKSWVENLDEIRKIASETSLLLNQLCDEMVLEFESVGDGVDVDNLLLQHTLKNPFSPLNNIPTRYFGKKQDLIFDELFLSQHSNVTEPTLLDIMWKGTTMLCATESAIRYCEATNRPKLYKGYKNFNEQMRGVAELLSSLPDYIISYTNSIGIDNP